jgi:hypothetical protein
MPVEALLDIIFSPKGTALASEPCLAQNMPATTATPPRLEPATLPLLDEEQRVIAAIALSAFVADVTAVESVDVLMACNI